MATKTILLSAIGLGGTVVGGYYAVEALTDERVPVKNTIERKLRKEGYTKFIFKTEEWQANFKKFKEGSHSSAFTNALKEEGFAVTTSEEDIVKGGEALKKWCEKALELEKDEGHKTIENAKLFCAEKVENKPTLERGLQATSSLTTSGTTETN